MLRALTLLRSLLVLSAVVLLLLEPTAPSRAQGFNTFNGRNHPELDWQVARTAHFEIMVPARLAGVEAEIAPIAEASYDALAANLDVTFDRRIRIYVSDEDEIGNGFAVPLGDAYTAIWVRHNAIMGSWTGRASWLRRVVAHELAHIFHYEATRSNLGLLSRVFGNPTPRFWTEGLAQYQTERWDAYRGDQWLRTAVLDDALSYDDGRSIWNGRLLYAVGNAQTRYLTQQYGDSTLTRLLAHRDTVLFGLGRVHDFETAFEATVGKSHRDFYDDWRRHVNVYYNTLAGQLETLDSLGVDSAPSGDADTARAETLSLPGRFLHDVQYSPDTTKIAVLATASPERPVRRLYVVNRGTDDVRVVAEGPIEPPIAWHPSSERLAFARRTRGHNGSLLYDLFTVDADGGNLRQRTRSRRAHSPTFGPNGDRLAFIGVKAGRANLFVLELSSGTETRITDVAVDVHLAHARWHPAADTLAAARMDPDGTRDIVLIDANTGAVTSITDGTHDDRRPVWRPDGRQLAYTSLRDDVPNAFVYTPTGRTHKRVTQLAHGATVHDWHPPDSAYAAGRLALVSTVTKHQDRAYALDARRRTATAEVNPPDNYAAWTTHAPPNTVPPRIAPDASLIETRSPYNAWANLSHVASLAFPYYSRADGAGLAGFTTWTEPLGKHTLAAAGALSVTDLPNSHLLGSYVNRQYRPTLAFSGYRLPGSGRVYGNGFLVEETTGGDVTATWPLDIRPAPYRSTAFRARLRYVNLTPLNADALETAPALPPPEAGQQADLRLTLTRQTLRPYRDNLIHPLDGGGVRLQATGAARLLGADTQFLRGDLTGYRILPGLMGRQRLYVYGRAQVQTGDLLAQNVLGLSRYDEIRIGLPGGLPVELGDIERVRGHRTYALGNRVLFGSVEYRVPLWPTLRTELLGTVALGSTTLAAFADGGAVWTGGTETPITQAGVGIEAKNILQIASLRIGQALGIAWPTDALRGPADVYYRIRTGLPFWP